MEVAREVKRRGGLSLIGFVKEQWFSVLSEKPAHKLQE